MRKKPVDKFEKAADNLTRTSLFAGTFVSNGKVIPDNRAYPMTSKPEDQMLLGSPSTRRRTNRRKPEQSNETKYTNKPSKNGYMVSADPTPKFTSTSLRRRRTGRIDKLNKLRKLLRDLSVDYKIVKVASTNAPRSQRSRGKRNAVKKIYLRGEMDLMVVKLGTTSPILTNVVIHQP